MHRSQLFLWIIGLLILVVGIFWLSERKEDSSGLTFAVAELDGLESLQREFGKFRDLLVAKSKVPIKFYSVPNRVAATEALAPSQIDLLVAGPAEYVIIAARSPVEIVVGLQRANYYCVVVTRKDSGIHSLPDFAGRKLAIGDPGFTSKHLAPLLLLKQAGLKPADVTLIHTSSVQMGWEALLAGDVDGFATTSDKYESLFRKSSADTQSKIHLLKRSDNGESQRVTLARALFGRPRLFLADEPAASLDPSIAHEMMDAFQPTSFRDVGHATLCNAQS